MQEIKLSTNGILLARSMGYDADQRWIDWAVDMLVQGVDSLHVAILAGETAPFNQFEMRRVTDAALIEMELDWSDREQVIRAFTAELLTSLIAGHISSTIVLESLRQLTIDLREFPTEYDVALFDFYQLRFAQTDLQHSDASSYHWPGVTRDNIEQIIVDQARKWLEQHPAN